MTLEPEIAASIAALDELGAAEDLAVALHRAAQIELLAGDTAAAEPLMRSGPWRLLSPHAMMPLARISPPRSPT